MWWNGRKYFKGQAEALECVKLGVKIGNNLATTARKATNRFIESSRGTNNIRSKRH